MVNQIFGWSAVLVGLLMGLFMGIRFQDEQWLGGYAALPRRMVRLAHIAAVALGMLNIQFGLTADALRLPRRLEQFASLLLISSAVLMPLCCLWVAARKRDFALFAAPVTCLLAALVVTIGGLLS